MQNIYKETRLLDKRAMDKFLLSEEILVENASFGLYEKIKSLTHKRSVIYIVCGGGNNGADGLALARKLDGNYVVRVYMASEPKTSLCEREFFRCKNAGVEFSNKLYSCDVVVDCLYGSGFKGELSLQDQKLIYAMNKMARIKIACDLPSGVLQKEGRVAFCADWTLCMGAIKLDLFQDWAKDCVGRIEVIPLGISRESYEISSKIKLLERSDLVLPKRHKSDVHKGEYGHLAILCKDDPKSKSGAGVLSALSGVAFGAGLVTLVGKIDHCPYCVMNDSKIPHHTTAVAFGMGAGVAMKKDFDDLGNLPCVLDADVFYSKDLIDFLKQERSIVLTPHIKEFASLLQLCGIANLSKEEVKSSRIGFVEEFCSMFPHIVLVLKGTNTIIAKDQNLHICTFGSNNLAKGGSGDVLSGMIASLLAQGYDPLKASISGVLAHALASEKINSSYGLNPMDLIEAIKYL